MMIITDNNNNITITITITITINFNNNHDDNNKSWPFLKFVLKSGLMREVPVII